MALCESTFVKLIKNLSRLGNVVNLSDAVKSMKQGSLKGINFAITFDDGYLDNYTIARSILFDLGKPATFFVPIRQIDEKSIFWWDYIFSVVQKNKIRFLDWIIEANIEKYCNRKNFFGFISSNDTQKISRNIVRLINSMENKARIQLLQTMRKEFGEYEGPALLMNWSEIKGLKQQGFDVGSHTISHIPLTNLSESQANYEIMHSKELLSEKIDSDVNGFCYPRGAFNQVHEKMVQEHNYSYAVSTHFGCNTDNLGLYSLRRRNISDYPDFRNRFSHCFHLLELSGMMDFILSKRRIA